MGDNAVDIGFVERAVCDTVSRSLRVDVPPDALYKGLRVPAPVQMSRYLCLYSLHDIYGLSYRVIAEHSGIDERSVKRCVCRTRELMDIDTLFHDIGVRVVLRLYSD